MKKYVFLAVLAALFLGGCASKDLNYEPREVVRDYNASWQFKFENAKLNELIDMALRNNENLRVAAANLGKALANAGLARDDLFPTLSASASGTTSRDISTNDNWAKTYKSQFALSWELDIYGRIYDAYASKNWSAIESSLSLVNTRLSIVNSVIDEYFHILYLNDQIRNLNSNLNNLRELDALVNQKYTLGKEEFLAVRQSRQNMLNVENNLLAARRNLETSYETLNNLTRNSERFDELGILDFNLEDLDFKFEIGEGGEVKFDFIEDFEGRIARRPDVNAALAALNAAFYDYRGAQKAFYPSITVGGSLGDSDEKFSKSFGFNLLSGNFSVKLPFLDYFRLKNKLKVSEYAFEGLRATYEKTLKNAINEAIKYGAYYEIDRADLENLEKILAENEKIVELYERKYDAGRTELKDLLNARNDLIGTQNSFLKQKYLIISDYISYNKASAR